ncbi:predicted protein [Naegleria gruberi]|uniref:Predicted protein n=1 Tax=Naegleria gruberi TaxID=5762 RepID=D2VWN5_NAEGR|nr:uncharacterized protein NAEGRDRAFT_73444 [Naegleria gruberi]EFC38653.1 predicted protein [Naegleria gruberi]|eukprot:XP_002671397.1 predicted protein [Naegleria gruberi strain NEG-M]
MRVSQLKKVKTALNNLNLEIQVISDRCNNYDGDDCNITRALNITGEFMYFSFDNGDLADKYGIPTESYGMSFSDASPRKPYYGKYAVFNKATSSNFNTNSPTWVTFGTGKSLSLWLRKLTNTDSGVVWSFLMSQPPLFQHMGSNGLASSDNLEFYWKTSSTLPIRFYSSSKLLDNEWHHLAVVCKATGVDIYIDGVLDNSSSSTFDPVTSNIKFGGLQGINSAFFSGHMDEIRMFNVELTAAQIQQIYNY